jgi:hypothetical protein
MRRRSVSSFESTPAVLPLRALVADEEDDVEDPLESLLAKAPPLPAALTAMMLDCSRLRSVGLII